jgi:anti-sigma factor RsiW
MSEEAQDAELDDEMIVALSDYLDGALSPAQRKDVDQKLAHDAVWKTAYDEMVETRKLISGMHKARAPESFAQDVTATIHKRSAGRFFGARTFGDRVPVGAIVIVALVLVGILAYVMWSSQTGSLERNRDQGAPHDDTQQIVPKP